jgi:hypothetical protein
MTCSDISLLASSIPSGQFWLVGVSEASLFELETLPSVRATIGKGWLWAGDPRTSLCKSCVVLSIIRREPAQKDWQSVLPSLPISVFAPHSSGSANGFFPQDARIVKLSPLN